MVMGTECTMCGVVGTGGRCAVRPVEEAQVQDTGNIIVILFIFANFRTSPRAFTSR